MTTVTGTAGNDTWYLVAPGTVTLDGLGGTDTLYMGTSLRSSYTIVQSADGAVHVDTVSGASAAFHGTLYNMETLVFNNGKDTLDLSTYFGAAPITGTAGNDNLIGTAGNDTINGLAGNDTITGGAGNDTLDGGAGIDTAVYSGSRANYTLTMTGSSYTVKDNVGTDGTDTLANVERLQFADGKLALDMGAAQSGGEVALLIGAVLGKAALSNKAVVGQLLAFFDAGNTLHDAANVLVNTGTMTQLASGASTGAYVNLIYQAVVGQAATPDVTAQLSAYIDGGGYTKADFLAVIAGLAINQTNVDLVGLAQTGIAYT